MWQVLHGKEKQHMEQDAIEVIELQRLNELGTYRRQHLEKGVEGLQGQKQGQCSCPSGPHLCSSFCTLLSPGSDVTGVLTGNKDVDAGKENTPSLCPALDPGLWEVLRKFHELLLLFVLDIHTYLCCFCIFVPLVERVPTFSWLQPRNLSLENPVDKVIVLSSSAPYIWALVN